MESLTELLADAKSLRDDYSEEIPNEIVHGKLKFKVQKNWLNRITIGMISAQTFGIIEDQAVVDTYNKFERYLTETNIWGRNSTATDIQKGNEFLNYLIGYCEQKVGK
ncbi:MAG: hypothetical protein V1831_03030 [Candidatus Woesearchaeota archaeon]